MAGALLGIEIGGTKLQIVTGDASGRIEARWRGRVEVSGGAESIRRQIEAGVKELIGKERVTGVGVGFGGPVNWRTGRIERSHQVEGWSGFAIGPWVEDLVGAPAAVDNDANVAGLGEALCGAGMGADPVFYVTLGSGVGGGLVVGGRIYHGQVPGEAEFGHLRLNRSGLTVEQRCSGWAVDARIRSACAEKPGGWLEKRTQRERQGGEARFLAEAIGHGDELAAQILRELGEDLGFALSHVVHLFHPQRIVIGGGLSLVGGALREAVAAALPGFVMEAFRPAPAVELARLGEDAVPVGALRLAGAR